MKSFPDKLLRFCQIVGGLPVECTPWARGIKALIFSNTGFLWSITSVILQEFLSTITLYMHFMVILSNQSLRSLDRSTVIVITLDIVSLQVVAAVTFFSSAWKYPRLVSVFDTLERVYKELQHKSSEVKRAVKLLGIYAVALMLVTIFYRMVLMNHSDQAFSLAVSFVTIVLLFCPQAALFVHFTHVAQSITKSYFMTKLDDLLTYSLDRSIGVIITLDIVSLQVVAAAIFFSSAWKYPRLFKVFDTLERVCQDLQHKTSEVKRKVKILGIYAAALMSVTFSEQMVHVRYNGTTFEQPFLFATFFVTMILLYCSQAALLVPFTHVAQSIAKCFEIVNAKIETEVTSPASVDGSHARSTIQSKIKKLRTLMNTYWMLCDAVHQANVFYCDQLMAVTFSSFLHITVSSYYFFLLLKTSEVFIITNEGAWILLHICYVILLLNSSTVVTNKLEGFLLQLPHHNARFSARGYFLVNNETLTAMAGAAITYLVILIQFQSEPSST